MNRIAYIALAIFFPLLIVAYEAFYSVNETEQVIITQFGKPVGDIINEAGLKLKIPFIQKVNRIEKRICSGMARPTICRQRTSFTSLSILLAVGG